MVVVVSATAATSTTAELNAAMEEFFRTLRRVRGRVSQDQAGPITFAQFALLDVLVDGEPRTVGHLAEAGGVAQPTATRMLESLANAGIVQRTPHALDRRCTLISLTPVGEEALAAKRAEVEARREHISRSLSAQERRDAAVLLRRLSTLMEQL